MKKYNVQNYIRYKEDLKKSMPPEKFYDYYTRDEMIIKFLPLVENLARKFSTSQQASGVMSINDRIQEGSKGLILAVDRLEWDEKLVDSPDIEKTLKSFFSKRIKGAIRRAIDINRGSIKIPEHQLNNIRKSPKDEKMVAMFFNSIFSSYDEYEDNDENPVYQVIDKSEPYNIALLNVYLLSLMKQHLSDIQYDVLRMSYGLDCDKISANEIAKKIGLQVATANVRVSQIKKDAVTILIDKVDASQVIDYL